MICAYRNCQQPIQDGEATVEIGAGVAQLGKKSGVVMHMQEGDKVIVHYRCILAFFSPEYDQETYDAFYNRVEAEVMEDKKTELYEEAMDQLAQDAQHLCPACREELDDMPLEEMTCMSCGHVGAPCCANCGDTGPRRCTECGELVEDTDNERELDEAHDLKERLTG